MSEDRVVEREALGRDGLRALSPLGRSPEPVPLELFEIGVPGHRRSRARLEGERVRVRDLLAQLEMQADPRGRIEDVHGGGRERVDELVLAVASGRWLVM